MSRRALGLLWGALVFQALIFCCVVLRTRIGWPVSDMLVWLDGYFAAKAGVAGAIAYLWAWHNQHHLVWIKCLAAIDAQFLGMRGWAFTAAAVLASGGTAAMLAWAWRRGAAPAMRGTYVLAPMLILTSACALDCGTPIYAPYPLTTVFSVAALLLASWPVVPLEVGMRQLWALRCGALLAAAGAGLASGAGLVVWPALGWCAWRCGAGGRWVLGIGLCAAAFGAVYLAGFRADGAVPLHGAAQCVAYFCGFLGLPFSAAVASGFWGPWLGAGVAFISAGLIMWGSFRRRPLAWFDCAAIGFLIIGLLTALLAALGRSGLGADAVLPLRYSVLMAPLQVALCWFALRFLPTLRLAQAFAAGFVVLLLGMQLAVGWRGVRVNEAWDALAADYYRGERRAAMVPLIFPDLAAADVMVARLRQHGL